MTALRFVLAFVFLLFWNTANHNIRALGSVSGKDWLFLLVISIASGVVSLFVYYKGLEHTSASIATLAELGFPMAAVLVNWIFLKSVLTPVQILGMSVLLFSVFKLSGENTKTAKLEVPALTS